MIGRARIEQQKKVELAKIQAKKESRLEQLDIDYETVDKIRKTFGYIGMAFLTILFGSIFGNDLIKVLVYYFNGLKEWWGEKKQQEEEELKQTEEKSNEKRLEINQTKYDDIDEDLERFYFKLVKLNAINRRNKEKSSSMLSK